MRSGFVAGDADIIQAFFRYRTYHGGAMAPYTQAASIKAWGDEHHVIANRRLYRDKFSAVIDILSPVLDVRPPQGGFYLWPRTPVDDTVFARELYARYHVTVLPGSYLSRESGGIDPGRNRVRIALVAGIDECIDAAQRIRELCQSL
jgi:N-succinyldiaminopimelate aminotransferase